MKRVIALLSLFSLLGAGCSKGLDTATLQAIQRVELNIWGVVDDVAAYQPVLDDYQRLHPYITLNFRRLRLEEYEQALLEGMAEDRGPDIFLIHHDWVSKYTSKLVPMPAGTKIAYSVVTGTIKKEQTYQLRTEPTLTLKSLKDQYADVVIQDVLRSLNVSTKADAVDFQTRVVGLPVSVDTLAMYYNKDLLNAAGIAEPATKWDQFQEHVKKLTKLDANGGIIQSGAAIGTGSNVERGTDVFAALVMQNGAEMISESGVPAFQNSVRTADGESAPGVQALEFYTDFANPSKETYTWNNSQPNSIDAFIRGTTAYFFGYAYQLAQIRAGNPKLNLGIAPLPQIEGRTNKNIANYWMWVVSKKTKNADIAWNFLNFIIKPEENKKILDVIKRPAARKAQLADQLQDEDVGPFASQVLTAKSWYQGADVKTAEQTLIDMLDSVAEGRSNVQDAMRFAVEKLAQTLR